MERANGAIDNNYHYFGVCNLVGGSPANWISSGVIGSVIAGGGFQNYFYNGNFMVSGSNTVLANFSFVGGGCQNSIQTNSHHSFLGGGNQNSIQKYSSCSFLGGGAVNAIQPNAFGSFLGGGYCNTNGAPYSVVPGGDFNYAGGANSFAAGHRAKAIYSGDFVWADSQAADFNATATNQFLIRASGGVGIGLTNPTAQLHVSSSGGEHAPQVWINETTTNGSSVLRFTSGGDYDKRWDVATQTNRFAIYSGQFGNDMLVLDSGGLAVRGTFVSTSDRNAKENFWPVDAQEVLGKVASLPLSRWNYKQDAISQHIGPMAQDFYAAFNVGPDDKHITTVDESGVALAAIQGLNAKLEKENAELKARLEKLEQIVGTLTGGAK